MSVQQDYWPKARWASVKTTGNIVSLSTQSGFRRTAIDPHGEHILLKRSEATNTLLGVGLLKCLAASRILDTDEKRKELYALDNLKRNYEQWVAELMTFADIKTRRALFKEMHSCSVTLEDGVIIIEPWLHEKLEAWGGLADGESHTQRVAADAPPAAIGAAVIEALKRCWPPYPWQKELG